MRLDDQTRRLNGAYVEGRLTRRHLLGSLSLLGLSAPWHGASLAASGDVVDDAPTAASASATSTQDAGIPAYIDQSKLTDSLVLLAWNDYMDPELISEFSTLYGVQVAEENFINNEEMLSKIQVGAAGYDLTFPSDYMVDIMRKIDLLEPLDYDVFQTSSNLDPATLEPYYDPDNAYSTPYFFGTTGYSYDTAVLGEGLDSWDSAYQPVEAAQGKIVMLDDGRWVIGTTLLYLGYDIADTTDQALAAVKEALLEQKKHLLAYSNAEELIVSGESVVQQLSTGNAVRAQEQKPTLEYIIPKEGGIIWQDNLVIPKGAPNKYTAMAFIDFLNQPEIAARNALFTTYPTPNKAARESSVYPAELASNTDIYPEAEVFERLYWLQDAGEDQPKLDRLWSEVKSA